MGSQQDRAAEKRRQKLEQVQEQIKSGSLTVRQMTPKERKANPPAPPRPKRSGR